MKQGLVQLFVVLTLTLLACKRGPAGRLARRVPLVLIMSLTISKATSAVPSSPKILLITDASGKATTMFITAKTRVMSMPSVVP